MYYAATREWSAKCVVCETEMTRGIAEHLPSLNHWKKLWEKLRCAVPAPDQANDWSKPWVQRLQTTKGLYMFNHLTGQQGFESEIAAGAPGFDSSRLLILRGGTSQRGVQ